MIQLGTIFAAKPFSYIFVRAFIFFRTVFYRWIKHNGVAENGILFMLTKRTTKRNKRMEKNETHHTHTHINRIPVLSLKHDSANFRLNLFQKNNVEEKKNKKQTWNNTKRLRRGSFGMPFIILCSLQPLQMKQMGSEIQPKTFTRIYSLWRERKFQERKLKIGRWNLYSSWLQESGLLSLFHLLPSLIRYSTSN